MKSLRLLVAVLGAVALSSLPALAGEGSGSLPQLDATLYPGQIFWLAICFPLFFLLMSYWAVPKVQKTQENRRQILDGDLGAARKASDHAKTIMSEGEKALADARATVRANVESITAEANKKAAAQKEAQDKKIQTRLAEASGKIEAARAAALKEVPAMVADLSASIAAKILAARR